MAALTAQQAGLPLLIELRAALAAGAAAHTALVAAHDRHPQAFPGLAGAVRTLGMGASLAQAARQEADPDAAMLLRALAVAEHAGAGAQTGVDQAEAALRERQELDRQVRVHSAQARGSLRVLAWAPVVVLALFVLLEPEALGFYRLGFGRVCALAALLLVAGARLWARRIVAAVPHAVTRADPLAAPAGSGAAETAELLAVCLTAGLSPAAGITVLAQLGPPAARPLLRDADGRVVAGAAIDEAFAHGALWQMGAALGAAARWGSPGAAALRAYAAEVRRDRRAALQQAAQRVELRLVFPTTLLTLPAFLIAVVPPLLWTGLRS